MQRTGVLGRLQPASDDPFWDRVEVARELLEDLFGLDLEYDPNAKPSPWRTRKKPMDNQRLTEAIERKFLRCVRRGLHLEASSDGVERAEGAGYWDQAVRLAPVLLALRAIEGERDE